MKVTYKNHALLVFLFLGLAACPASGQIDGISSGDKIHAGWEIPFNGSRSEPIVHNGIGYIGSFDGIVHAIDAKNGKHIWQYQTGIGLTSGPEIIMAPSSSFGDMLGAALDAIGKKDKGKREIDATPVVTNGTIYIGSKDHKFYALDAKTGQLKWATDIGYPIFEKAIETDKQIVVHSFAKGLSPNAIFVLDKKDGQVLWSMEGKGLVTYPALSGNVVYYGLSENKDSSRFSMNAAEVSTGKLLWTLELQGRRPERIYSSSELIYVTAFEGGELIHLPDNTVKHAPTATRVYAVNASTGKLVWEYKGGKAVTYAPPALAVGPKNVFFVEEDGLHAVDKTTGNQSWFLEGKYFYLNLQFSANVLYVDGDGARKNESISAVDVSSGEVLWRASPGENLYLRGIIGDTVYVSSGSSLISIDAKTGKKLWKFNTGGFFKEGAHISAAPVKYEGQLIFSTETNIIWGSEPIQGHLYSVDANTGKLK